jgi:hypothetical protein
MIPFNMIVIKSGEQKKLWSFVLCCFLQPFIICSVLAPNFLFSAFFQNIHNPACPPFGALETLSHPYKTTYKARYVHSNIYFPILDSRWKCSWFWSELVQELPDFYAVSISQWMQFWVVSLFENVSQFKYLGTTATNQNLIQEEIKMRMNSGNACYQ